VPIVEVPRRNGAVKENIPTSHVLLEYTTFMRGVDVANQLHASYSSQTRSHKWWHRVFWALLDVTEVNMYIMYLDRYKQGPNLVTHPMTHLKFKNTLCKALLVGWGRRNEVSNETLTHRPSIHMPSHSSIKRLCIHCKIHTPHTYCYKCGFKFMCWKEGCFQEVHERLARQRYNILFLCLQLYLQVPFFFILDLHMTTIILFFSTRLLQVCDFVHRNTEL
jgi:hypothetical protein